jgi:hypothetical protein
MLTRAQLADAAAADLLADAVGKIRRREDLRSANPRRSHADRQ